MKILIVDNTELISKDGDYCVESRAGDFIVELKSLGNEVAVFGQKLKPASNTVNVFRLEANGISVKGLRRKNNKLLNYLALYAYALVLLKRYDFVYLFYPGSFRYFAFICTLLNKPFGLYIRGVDDVYDRVSKSIYKKATLIYTVSDMFTNTINEYLDTGKARTIRPMIPYSEFDIVEGREYTKKEFFKILYFGRIAEEKGIKELLLATNVLRQIRTDFVVEIIGNGEFFEDTEKLIEELSLSALVTLKGPEYEKQKIREIYLEADLFILPTYHEGFPRTLYEAMIFGTPIATTLVGGIPQLMKDKVNCFEIKVKSVDSIVEVLSLVFSNYKLVKPISENSTYTMKNLFATRKHSHALDLNTEIRKILK